MYRLVLPPRLWREQFPPLARAAQQGIAYLQRHVVDGGCELIAAGSPLRPAVSARGGEFGPLDNLLLVQFTREVPLDAAEALLARFQPAAGQLAVGLVLGIDSAAGHWAASVWDCGTRWPLAEFLLVGPGMRRVSLERPVALPDADGRWSRTRGALGDQVWQRVRGSRVAIVGASRSGSVAAFAFAMLGVRELVLIDADRDQWHNLDASLGAAPEWVGDYKVFNRRAALLQSRPEDLQVQAIPLRLPHPCIDEQLRGVDLICTCVDRDAARLGVARLAQRFAKIHLDIGTGVHGSGAARRIGGDVRLLLPGEACVVCLGGLGDPDRAAEEAVAPPGALLRGRRQEWQEQRAGSLLTVNSVTVHLGIQMWLDLLAGRLTDSRWLRAEWDAAGVPSVTLATQPSAGCQVCRRRPNLPGQHMA